MAVAEHHEIPIWLEEMVIELAVLASSIEDPQSTFIMLKARFIRLSSSHYLPITTLGFQRLLPFQQSHLRHPSHRDSSISAKSDALHH